MKKSKRTIESILDLKTGKEIRASEFFSKPIDEIFKYRYKFESYIRENKKRYVCYFCKQNVKIRGKGSERIFHFAHFKDSDDCPIKTNNKFTKREIERIKYNGAKESELHFYLKELIAFYLRKNEKENKGISNVLVEKVQKDKAILKKWKKPDVSASYKGKKIVFELQLSTTFLSVINERQEFYKKNNTYILWIFSYFENNIEKRKFTQSDIFYNNNRNGFEFDKKAQELSKKYNDLILNCYYEQPKINDELEIEFEWKSEYIKLSQLTFGDNYKIYFFDVEKEKERLIEIINKKKVELEISNSKFLKVINEKNFYKLINLFKEKNLTDNEYEYLINIYTNKISKKDKIKNYTSDFLIIWTLILHKIKSNDLFDEFINNYDSLKKVITDLLSLKTNKIIGYEYDKQVQIAHLLLQRFPMYKNYYVRGMNVWQNIEPDKRKKLINKIKRIDEINKRQIENCKIIDLLFPELKSNAT